MEPEYWLNRWQRGEIGWHGDETNRHLRTFWPQLGVPAGALVLVPLCGKTRDLLWLASRGDRVLGVEISELGAKSFFSENGLDPTVTNEPGFRRYRVDQIEILCGDFFDLQPEQLGHVGAVYDRAALIALPRDQRVRYAAHLESLIPYQVPRLLVTLEYDQSAQSGPPFSVPAAEVHRLFEEHHRVRELACFDVIDESPGPRQRGLTKLLERVYRLDRA